MAYNEELCHKVRQILKSKKGYNEKKMFGGICFQLRGNMACGILNDELIVRVGPENYLEMLQLPYTREFDITGRAMKGWVMVAAPAIEATKDLSTWVDRGAKFARSLPKK